MIFFAYILFFYLSIAVVGARGQSKNMHIAEKIQILQENKMDKSEVVTKCSSQLFSLEGPFIILG